jgi:hypothetical protein
MHVSTNGKSKEPLKLTFTEKNRLDQAEQVAKAIGGGALMLGDMELREVADKAQIALVKLKLFLSDKRPAPDAQTTFLADEATNTKGTSDGNPESNRGADKADAAHGKNSGDSKTK